jgi:selenocysteine-specific translation elongation factor
MDNEIKSKLNNKYNLSSEDYEMISARIDELRKAIEDVIEFEEKNKLSNNPLIMKNDRNFK